MQQTTKRLDHIDIAKAIGLLLVIYGHTFRMSMRAAHPWCAFSYTFVYRFHVPLLFLLSGMGCTLTAQKNRSLSARQFVRKKAHSLLLPWGIYSAFLYSLFYLANLVPPVRALLSGGAYQLKQPAEYLWLVLRNENPYGFHLWYLPTLVLVCPHGMAAGQSSRPRQQPGRQSWHWWWRCPCAISCFSPTGFGQ